MSGAVAASVKGQLTGIAASSFTSVSIDPLAVTEDGAVLLDEAVATYDCSVHAEIEAGDHVIVLLALHAVGAGDGEHPLVFHRSAFAKLHRDDLDPARLDGRINGAEVDRGDDHTSAHADAEDAA